METTDFILIFICFSIIVIIIGIGEINMEEQKTISEIQKLYQGPVPLGYDEEHFRKTGVTIKVECENFGNYKYCEGKVKGKRYYNTMRVCRRCYRKLKEDAQNQKKGVEQNAKKG